MIYLLTMTREAYVYILVGNIPEHSPEQGAPPIYVGSTTDFVERVTHHREGEGSEHTSRYRIKRLVGYEVHDSIASAQARERRVKRWNRDWKDELIEAHNPD